MPLIIVFFYRSMFWCIDTVQPVAPLADDRRGSAIPQGGMSGPNVIEDSER